MDGADPVGEGERLALRRRNRDQRHLGEFLEERHKLGRIEPPVQGGQGGRPDPSEQREDHVVEMEMEDVESLGGLRHALQHQMIGRQPVADAAIEPQPLPTHRRQAGARQRIAAGEEGDVVAQRDELLGQTRHDPLRAAVEFRRHGLVEGGNLGNSHGA